MSTFKTYEIRLFQGAGDVDLTEEIKTAIDSYFKAQPVNVNRIRVQANNVNDSEFWKED